MKFYFYYISYKLISFNKGIFLYNKTTKPRLKTKKQKMVLITFVFFLILLINVNIFDRSIISNIISHNDSEDIKQYNQILEISNGGSFLFQGYESPLNITDTGNLYEYNQEISIVNQEEINLSYYLDDEHAWKCSKIEANITAILDTRNWVNNSGFKAPIIYRKYDSYESSHPYIQNRNPGDRVNTISEPTATYMRVHFKNCSFDI